MPLPLPSRAIVTIQHHPVSFCRPPITLELQFVAPRLPIIDVATLIRALVTLGRLGVGGRFRAAYLQRRLARETDGAVVLDLVCGTCDTQEARTMTLAEMQTVIEGWYTQSGLCFPSAGPVATNSSSARERGARCGGFLANRRGRAPPELEDKRIGTQ